jgi:nucleotide-binding universal stress UspA family protein
MSSFPNKILLATDGSEYADLAARAAVELSNRTASELHVVHVWHDVPTPHFHSFVRAQLRQEAEETLQRQLERIEQAGGTVAKSHLREGRTIDEILGLSEELEIGPLIVGSRGLGGVGVYRRNMARDRYIARQHPSVHPLTSAAPESNIHTA